MKNSSEKDFSTRVINMLAKKGIVLDDSECSQGVTRYTIRHYNHLMSNHFYYHDEIIKLAKPHRCNKDFDSSIVKSLEKNGWIIDGGTWLSNDKSGIDSNGESGYILISSNGTSTIKSYTDVIAMAQ